jgi:AmmeMemoRadiSam system protein A
MPRSPSSHRRRLSMLDEAEGLRLARYARSSIRESLGGPVAARPCGGDFEQPAATFVTLHRHGQLHGCMGVVEARRPLADDVHDHAVAAALDDPRAAPLALAQVDDLDVEVSLLTPLERVPALDAAMAAAALRPGIDGVVFAVAGRRSTYLPQVWEDLPEPVDFLRKLRKKAGLPADYWSGDVMIFRYQVRKWGDPAPAAHALEKSP